MTLSESFGGTNASDFSITGGYLRRDARRQDGLLDHRDLHAGRAGDGIGDTDGL